MIGKFIHPVSEKFLKNGDVDIVFLHGHKSHPIGCWRILREDDPTGRNLNPEIWLKKYLEPDLAPHRPRIFYTGYETMYTEGECDLSNLPNFDLPDLAA